jgi:hypothetical protein
MVAGSAAPGFGRSSQLSRLLPFFNQDIVPARSLISNPAKIFLLAT